MNYEVPREIQCKVDTNAVADANRIRGLAVVTSIAARNTIDSDKRKLGHICSVIGSGIYQYIGGDLTNVNWELASNWVLGSSVEKNILTINDANLSTYVGTGTGSSNTYLIDIPENTDIISIETTSNQKFFGVQFTAVANGKRVTIIGNSVTEFACSGSETANGRFSSYLYRYLHGSPGGTLGKVLDCFVDFIYWNGLMLSKGY